MTLPDPDEVAERFLGIPYAEMRCWALCCHVYRHVFGLELPTYPPVAGEAVQEYIDLEAERGAWARVPLGEVRPFDVLQMRVLRAADHVGIALPKSRVITTMRGINSMVAEWVPYDTPRRSQRAMRAECGWRHPKCL